MGNVELQYDVLGNLLQHEPRKRSTSCLVPHGESRKLSIGYRSEVSLKRGVLAW